MDTNLFSAISCLIIDDEQAAHISLNRLIETVPWLELKGHCNSGVEAIEVIATIKPQLIFLDIEMPGLNGLDLIGMLAAPRPQIILTTAFRDYAFEGFENDVDAFLLKPIKTARFYRSVIKARENIRVKHLQSIAGHAHQSSGSTCGVTTNEKKPSQADIDPDDSIWIYSGKKFHHLKLSELYAIEGLKDYVKVYYSGGKILVKGNIGSIERKLPQSQFFRIHRSYIVNRSAIRVIEGNMVRMPDGSDFAIPSYKGRENIINQLLARQRRI
ncbi:LytTR family DNA-binding domain-containing protein [Dyadobacter sp. CY261]|uniref:LytR/AlgR family response regulator transcription factor n=1 Tax=Dyadobacter sp. CY261 TaxID=2907203 RepID=UPI001F1A82B9|nr:LytTR family DNA-binding domain-containing protein [Dyadobacter sp. CY261]MCF0075645.1 LytTR family DNA-binding domain-containing protein [Dyadobacter sp. CY261]